MTDNTKPDAVIWNDMRALLKKYMDFVGNEEGITFVSRLRRSSYATSFSEFEIEVLEAIDSELMNDG